VHDHIDADTRLTPGGWRRETTPRGVPTGFWYPPEGPLAEQPLRVLRTALAPAA